MSDSIECPKCGKKAVVQRKEDVYQCLGCDFKKDFTQPPKPKSDNQILWTGVIVLILTSFILWTRESTVNPATSKNLLLPTPQISR